jgi:hypothetical protein
MASDPDVDGLEKAVEEKQSSSHEVAAPDSLCESQLQDAPSAGVVPLDARADRLLTAKLDLKVIPVMGLLFLICFLDRTNIANARLAGLESSLHMPSTGFNTALWIFYIPFVCRPDPLFAGEAKLTSATPVA